MKTTILFLSILLPLLFISCSSGKSSATLQVQIEPEQLTLNGERLGTLPTLEWFENQFGQARSISGSIYTIYVWDNQGICLFEKTESGKIHTLHIALQTGERDTRPRKPFSGQITERATDLTSETSRGMLLEKSQYETFYQSSMLQTTFGAFSLSLHFTDEDRLKTMEICPAELSR